MVAVGFNPRLMSEKKIRRGATIAAMMRRRSPIRVLRRIQSSLRDYHFEHRSLTFAARTKS